MAKRKGSPDWEERSYKLLTEKIDAHGIALREVHGTLSELLVAVGQLKVRSSIWGGLAGVLTAALAIYLGRK